MLAAGAAMCSRKCTSARDRSNTQNNSLITLQNDPCKHKPRSRRSAEEMPPQEVYAGSSACCGDVARHQVTVFDGGHSQTDHAIDQASAINKHRRDSYYVRQSIGPSSEQQSVRTKLAHSTQPLRKAPEGVVKGVQNEVTGAIT